MESKTYIKIYGIPRTGTNYIEWLLLNNFNCVDVFEEGNAMGWKHGKIHRNIDWSGYDWDGDCALFGDDDAYERDVAAYKPMNAHYLNKYLPLRDDIQMKVNNKEIIYIICTKNIYHSFYSFTKFFPTYNLREYIRRWNDTNNDYVSFASEYTNSMILRYEDYATTSYDSILTNIKRKFKLSPSKTPFVDLTQRIHARKVISGGRFDANSQCNYMDYYTMDMLEVVRSSVDLELCKHLNYDII